VLKEGTTKAFLHARQEIELKEGPPGGQQARGFPEVGVSKVSGELD